MTDIEETELFNKLLAEKLLTEGPWFDFDGNNCPVEGEDPEWNEGKGCQGWNGEDRRCDCGNRRVSWQLSYSKTYVYAEAY